MGNGKQEENQLAEEMLRILYITTHCKLYAHLDSKDGTKSISEISEYHIKIGEVTASSGNLQALRGRARMVDDSVFSSIRERSEGYHKYSHHSKAHVERIYNLAVRMGVEENANLDVVKVAALLHDIARAMEDEGKIDNHAAEGAKMARGILEGVDFLMKKIADLSAQVGDRIRIYRIPGI